MVWPVTWRRAALGDSEPPGELGEGHAAGAEPADLLGLLSGELGGEGMRAGIHRPWRRDKRAMVPGLGESSGLRPHD
jgi:hypothetical protein